MGDDRRTIGDRLLSLSATTMMPPWKWWTMQPHCHTCATRYDQVSGRKWPNLDRSMLRAMGAKQFRFTGGDIGLWLPLTFIWLRDTHADDYATSPPMPPFCLLHEIRPIWDGRLIDPDGFTVEMDDFGVQDSSRAAHHLEPLDDYAYTQPRYSR